MSFITASAAAAVVVVMVAAASAMTTEAIWSDIFHFRRMPKHIIVLACMKIHCAVQTEWTLSASSEFAANCVPVQMTQYEYTHARMSYRRTERNQIRRIDKRTKHTNENCKKREKNYFLWNIVYGRILTDRICACGRVGGNRDFMRQNTLDKQIYLHIFSWDIHVRTQWYCVCAIGYYMNTYCTAVATKKTANHLGKWRVAAVRARILHRTISHTVQMVCFVTRK